MKRDQKTLDQIRYNLGEDEFLNWEAQEDAAHEDECMTDDERAEWEREQRAELLREIPSITP